MENTVNTIIVEKKIEKTEADEQHIIYTDMLSNISIKELPGIDIRAVLFCITTYLVYYKSYLLIIKNIIKALFFKHFDVTIPKVKQNDILVFTRIHHRYDHDNYWKKFCSAIPKHDEIIFENIKIKPYITKLLPPDIILKNILTFLSIIKQLKLINNNKYMFFIAAQLVSVIQFYNKISLLDTNYKVLGTYPPAMPYDNFITQYFMKNGVKTVMMCHNEVQFYGFDRMRHAFDYVLNFISDYVICHGEKDKNAYLNAGYNSNRLICLGNLSEVALILEEPQNNIFCVLLEAPKGYPWGNTLNKKLLQTAREFSKISGYKYYVKPHPGCKKLPLLNSINDPACIDIIKPNILLKDILNLFEFALLHFTTSYIDLSCFCKKCYKIAGYYSAVVDEQDIVTDALSLQRKNSEWKNKTKEEKLSYFKQKQQDFQGAGTLEEISKKYFDFFSGLTRK